MGITLPKYFFTNSGWFLIASEIEQKTIIETLDTIQTKDIKDFSIKLLDNLLT